MHVPAVASVRTISLFKHARLWMLGITLLFSARPDRNSKIQGAGPVSGLSYTFSESRLLKGPLQAYETGRTHQENGPGPDASMPVLEFTKEQPCSEALRGRTCDETLRVTFLGKRDAGSGAQLSERSHHESAHGQHYLP